MRETDVSTFAKKMYSLLHSPEYSHLVGWCEKGDTFVIKSQRSFQQELFPSYFKNSSFNSFVRQLNMYGFKRISDGRKMRGSSIDSSWFEHCNFKRGREDLLVNINRVSNQTKKSDNHKGKPVVKDTPTFSDPVPLQETISASNISLPSFRSIVSNVAEERNEGPEPSYPYPPRESFHQPPTQELHHQAPPQSPFHNTLPQLRPYHIESSHSREAPRNYSPIYHIQPPLQPSSHAQFQPLGKPDFNPNHSYNSSRGQGMDYNNFIARTGSAEDQRLEPMEYFLRQKDIHSTIINFLSNSTPSQRPLPSMRMAPPSPNNNPASAYTPQTDADMDRFIEEQSQAHRVHLNRLRSTM